jgi:hypothetical protein
MRFEQDLPALLADLYVGVSPDYRDDLFGQTARMSQRPAWTFLERWIPVDIATRRLPSTAIPWRSIAVASLIAALLAATLLVVGSQHRVPPPFGPAANGFIIASKDGDIVTRDTATGASRLLIGGNDQDSEPGASPDGMLVAFSRTVDQRAFLTVADIDGRNIRRVHDAPLDEKAWAQWAPDSHHLGVINRIDGKYAFVLVSTDGGPEQVSDMGELVPVDFQFRPPDGREIAVRALDHGQLDLYLMNVDGSNIRKLGLDGRSNGSFGWQMDLSGLAWSPSGAELGFNAVTRDTPAGPDHFRLRVLTIATMQDVQFPAPADPDVQQAWPMWSPDGSQILLQRFTWQHGWLGLIPADGSSVGRDLGTPVNYEDDTNMDQGWSPDGRTILLRFDDDHFVSIDAATGVETPLTWPVDKIPDWRRVAA